MADYPKDPTNNAEALQTLADFVKTAPGRLPERVMVALSIAELESGGNDLASLRSYIPAPTWRPIAEMPAEWRDGRWVIVEDSYGDQWVARHSQEPDLIRPWHTDGGSFISPPTNYLDLTLQEVPRG